MSLFGSEQYQSIFKDASKLFEDVKPLFETKTTTKTTTTTTVSQEMPEVKFQKVSPNAVAPKFHTDGSAGFDLTTSAHVVVRPDSRMLVSTGLIIAAPKDHMLFITHRSSTPKRFGVHVLTGIVDEDYCGPEDVISIQVQNFWPSSVTIPMGSRIAQGVFIPVQRAKFVEHNFKGKSRGGYGSTG